MVGLSAAAGCPCFFYTGSMSTLVTLIIVVLFATLATAYASALRSSALRRKFEALGMIPGRTVDEIIRHVGKPSGRAPLGPGREVLAWRRINFQVALTFTAGVCDGVEYNASS